MKKIMGYGDVLRCLAKNLIYHPPYTEADTRCDRICVESGKNDFCLKVRQAINEDIKKEKIERSPLYWLVGKL